MSVVLFFCFLALSFDALEVRQKTFQVKQAVMDEVNQLKMVVFTVDTDARLYLGEGRLLASNDELDPSADGPGVQLCWNQYQCGCMPPVIQRQIGLYELQCGDRVFGSYPENPVDCMIGEEPRAPPDYLIPLPPAVDPVQGLLSMTRILETGSAPLYDRLSVGLFVEFRDLGVDYINNLFPKDYDFSTCELRIVGNITDEQSNTLTSPINEFTTPSFGCKYADMNALAFEMETAISNIALATDWLSMNQLRWKVPLLFSSDAWTGCLDLATNRINNTIGLASYDTLFCTHSDADPEWISDPCCNKILLWEQCCIPHQVDVGVNYYHNIHEDALSTCKSQENSKNTFLDLIVSLNAIYDLNSGCTADRQEIVDDSVYQKTLSFLYECDKLILGDGESMPICQRDSDCLTYCAWGQCAHPLDQWDEVFSKCYVSRMDESISRYLKSLWKLPADLDEESFRQEFVKHFSSENCVGLTSTGITSAGRSYRLVSEEECLSEKVCNWDSYMGEEECLSHSPDEFICGVCDGPYCYRFSNPPVCFIDLPNVNEEICASYGGTYDYNYYPFPCIYPEVMKEECLPASICPNSTDIGADYSCSYNFCYLPDHTEADCQNDDWMCDDETGVYDPLLYWEQSFASGQGLCIMSGVDPSTCADNGGTWYTGRVWHNGLYHTEETCTNTCLSGDYYYIGMSDESCLGLESCDLSCVTCDSARWTTLCYGDVPLCDCTSLGGAIDPTLQMCVVPWDKESCESIGFTYETCTSLSNDECFDCINHPESCPLNQGYLDCGLTRSTSCDYDQCQKSDSGRCNDRDYFNYFHEDCTDPFTIYYETSELAHCFYACRFDFSINNEGNAECYYWEYPVPDGCIDYYITTREECELYEGNWRHSSHTVDTCTEEQGCKDPTSTSVFTGKEPTVCKDCGGTYESRYIWLTPEWTTSGELIPLTWSNYSYYSINKFRPTLNFYDVYTTIEQQLTLRYAPYFQTELLCRYSSSLENLRYITCDCADDPGAPSNCYSSDVRFVSAGTQRFCSGLEDWIKTGSYDIRVQKESVPLGYDCINTNISLVPASQFRRNIPDSVSSDQLSGAANQGSNNPYSVVQVNGNYVGQIVGDGLMLEFEGYLNQVKVCASKRADVSISKQYQLPDFVSRNPQSGAFEPLSLATNRTGDVWCATIGFDGASKGVLFPAMLRSDWQSYSEEKDSTEFLYTVAAMDFSLSLISFVQVISMFYGDVFVARKLTISVQKLLHVNIMIFTVVRGVYILMVAMDDIEDGSLAQILLYDLPTLLFFSAYSCLIFFWAEITTNTRGMKENLTFASYLRPLLYRTNGLMYTCFTVFVILTQISSGIELNTLKQAYYYFLAFIALSMSLGFLYYGGRLWWTITSLKIAERSEKQKATLRKIAWVTFICTFSFLFQCTYLVVTLYKDVDDVNIALIPFVIAEFMPCAMMLFSFRNPVKSRLGSTNSHQSSRSFLSRFRSGFKWSVNSKDSNRDVMASIGANDDL
eukprot:TRINITY_DN8410_c1_g1_i1.p1 TRINITY_DN8410_c1_g1~~TRINITY_DN8410_c1_g1_i1.p1  ORF type:complete len:1497 (-),score=233.75 TRINITY_DN8410_c1_g1_i1:238-4728(-)